MLAGIECDILADGRMDLADDCLAELDIVIGSVHSAMRQEEDEMTARLIRAIENPWVDVIGHPTSRMLLKREPARVNIERVARAAAAHGVALEINSQIAPAGPVRRQRPAGSRARRAPDRFDRRALAIARSRCANGAC